MRPIHYLSLALFLVFGCQAAPTVTRTGDVKDIIIGDNLSQAEIVVGAGDEVRWINKRTAPVRIVLIDPVSDKQLSCTNNFGGWMKSRNTAKLATNETASACFRDPGHVRYTVRMEAANMTGERNVSGVIRVGGQAIGQTRDSTTGRSTGEVGDQTQKSNPLSSTSTTTTTTTTTTPGN